MNEEMREAVSKPQALRLKALNRNMVVSRVLGTNVLVRTVKPWTEMDEVERKGLLVIPEKVKEANEPRPTTGIVVQLGEALNGELKDGDMVMFSKYAGIDFYMQEDDYRVLPIENIMCVFDLVPLPSDRLVGTIVEVLEGDPRGSEGSVIGASPK